MDLIVLLTCGLVLIYQQGWIKRSLFCIIAPSRTSEIPLTGCNLLCRKSQENIIWNLVLTSLLDVRKAAGANTCAVLAAETACPHTTVRSVMLISMMYDSESLTNEKIPYRMFEAPPPRHPLPPPRLRLSSFEACLNRWNLFAADQDGRDWAGVAEVRAAIGQVLLPRPAGRPQSGRTHRLPTSHTRGHGEWFWY